MKLFLHGPNIDSTFSLHPAAHKAMVEIENISRLVKRLTATSLLHNTALHGTSFKWNTMRSVEAPFPNFNFVLFPPSPSSEYHDKQFFLHESLTALACLLACHAGLLIAKSSFDLNRRFFFEKNLN